jgi:DNA-binding FrmR family transcriptional regulator
MITYTLGIGTMNNTKQKSLLSIKKAIGTANKVQKMLEEDKYCIDIIQQIDAVIGLLKSSKKTILKSHLDRCLEHKIKENKDKTIDELMKIYSLGN